MKHHQLLLRGVTNEFNCYKLDTNTRKQKMYKNNKMCYNNFNKV